MTKFLVYALFVSSSFVFVVVVFLIGGPSSHWLAFAISFVMATLMLLWLRADADADAGHPSGRFKKGCALLPLPLIVLPVHFFHSRGIKRGFKATAGMLGLVFLFLVSGVFGGYVVVEFMQP